MTLALQLLVALIVTGLVGCVSFVTVVGVGVWSQRMFGANREGVIAILTALGMVVSFAAQRYDNVWLAAAGLILWGWIALLVHVCVVIAIWQMIRFVCFVSRRLTGRTN